MHHYMLLLAKAEDHDRLNMTLIGPPKIDRPSLIDERAGFVPPPWWKGDDYASRSGMTAMMTLKR